MYFGGIHKLKERKRCQTDPQGGAVSSPSTSLLDVPETHRRWSSVNTGWHYNMKLDNQYSGLNDWGGLLVILL